MDVVAAACGAVLTTVLFVQILCNSMQLCFLMGVNYRTLMCVTLRLVSNFRNLHVGSGYLR